MTTAPGALEVAHTAAPRIPTTLTRMQIAQDYVITNASLAPATAGADPSYAVTHESAALKMRGREAGAHAGESAISANGLFLRAAAELPPGWSFKDAKTIRHNASGLDCPSVIELTDEGRNFLLTDIVAWDMKNLDIGCIYKAGGGTALVLYASFWPQMSLEENVAGSVEAIAQQFDLHGDLPVSIATLETEESDPLMDGLETPRAGAFDIGVINGIHYKTALWLVKTYGWHVKARATYANDDMSAELVSAIMFALSHLNVREKNMSEPVTAGGEV